MKNVTITLEEEVARWARVAAAEQDMSLSRFVGEVLREHMQEQADYERAMQEFLNTGPTGHSGGCGSPSREDRHDRSSLRR